MSTQHPLESGHIFPSPGGHFLYRVIGPCCQLFDRGRLPWPCCRLEWHGKEPSWRRIGRRLVPDIVAKGHPSYCVEILGVAPRRDPLVITLYGVTLDQPLQEWWYAHKAQGTGVNSPVPTDATAVAGPTRER